MTPQEFEQRLTRLENEVAALRIEVQGTKPDWRRAIDELTGDEGLQEIFAEAMKLREKDRQKARKRR